jgi:hypothetical protein
MRDYIKEKIKINERIKKIMNYMKEIRHIKKKKLSWLGNP